MGHRHRPARQNLLFKQRNHAAVASQHIPETHRHKLRVIVLVEGLDNHFANPLAGPHDIRGVHRLVRGNHHEPLHIVHGRRLGGFKGAEHIILHRLVRAFLHQRHMLVGRRMIDNIRLIMLKNPVHTVGVPHGTNQNLQRQVGISQKQFLLHIVNAVFIDIQYDKHSRLVGGNLAA